MRAVGRVKPGRNGIALAARNDRDLMRRLGPEREKRSGGADHHLTHVDVRVRRMEHQLAPRVAAGKVLGSPRIEKDHDRDPPIPCAIARQRGVAVLVGNEKASGFVAQELERLMSRQRDPESLRQRRCQIRQTPIDETARGVADRKLCRMPDASDGFRAPVAMHGGRRASRGTRVGQHGIARRRIEKIFEENSWPDVLPIEHDLFAWHVVFVVPRPDPHVKIAS